MPRCLALLLIAVLIASASGVLPAAAASGDCCGEPCAEERDPAEPQDQDDCESQAEGDEGEGMGCPPLCTSCVCAAYFAPATLPATVDVAAATARAEQAAGPIARPASAPRTGVFHPPRPA